MAGRFINPYPQFFNATPTALSGAKLFFYAAGTSTKLNTYSDRGLSSANTNPIVLNSSGYPSVEIWLQDLDYKVVLAPSTDTDPPANPIWSSDYVRARDSALIAKTLTGSGSPSGVVAGTAGSASILPDFYWDYTNAILYVCTTTGTTSTAVWTAVNATSAAAVVPPPQGYLTLTTATPIIASDVTAAVAVYYTPYVGNLVPIYNGSSFNPTAFTELTLSLNSSHIASNIYDVYVFSNSGVLTLVTGPSWSAGSGGSITAGSCARGTGAGGAALARLNGTWTNAVQITGRNGATTYTIGANLATYVGSIFMDSSNGQLSCYRSWGSARKWGVWNAYNRAPIMLKTGTPNTTLPSSAGLWGGFGVTLTLFSGLAEEQYFLEALITGANSTTTSSSPLIGLGINSTSTISGFQASGTAAVSATAQTSTIKATYLQPPTLGITNISGVGVVVTGGFTYTGSEAGNIVSAVWRG